MGSQAGRRSDRATPPQLADAVRSRNHPPAPSATVCARIPRARRDVIGAGKLHGPPSVAQGYTFGAMRILHVVTAFPRTPDDVITPWLVELLRGLRAAGHEGAGFTSALRGGGDRGAGR